MYSEGAGFGVPDDLDEFNRIRRLRNHLFHETVWAGEQPGKHSESGTATSCFRGPEER